MCNLVCFVQGVQGTTGTLARPSRLGASFVIAKRSTRWRLDEGGPPKQGACVQVWPRTGVVPVSRPDWANIFSTNALVYAARTCPIRQASYATTNALFGSKDQVDFNGSANTTLLRFRPTNSPAKQPLDESEVLTVDEAVARFGLSREEILAAFDRKTIPLEVALSSPASRRGASRS